MSPEIDILPFLTELSQGLRGLALFAGVILILDSIKIHAGLAEDSTSLSFMKPAIPALLGWSMPPSIVIKEWMAAFEKKKTKAGDLVFLNVSFAPTCSH